MSIAVIDVDGPPKNELLTRRGKQRLKFLAATALTLAFSMRIHRTIKSLKYVPKTFDSNDRIPPPLLRGEAAKAFLLSTGITTGLFSMILFGGCWIFNISTPNEFRSKMEKIFRRSEEQNNLMDNEGTIANEWENTEITQVLGDIMKK